MRLGFRARPGDLFVVAGLAAVLTPVALLGIGGIAGFVASVVLVLFLPGYALVAVLFPGNGGIGWLQRTTLSLGLGLAVVALVGVLSNYAPWGIRIGPVLALLDLIAIGGCALAYVRRNALPPDRRLRLEVELSPVRWRGLSSLERALVACLGIALVVAGEVPDSDAASVAAGSLAYSASLPNSPPGFTEFYLLNETGGPATSPLNLSTGEPAGVILVIANHESGGIDYTITIVNATINGGIETGNLTLATVPLHVDAGSESRYSFPFRIDQPGEYALKFLLHVGPPGGSPYRFLRLRVTVT